MVSAAQRGGAPPSSFEKIFGAGPPLGNHIAASNDGSKPLSVHALFSATVREEISLRELAEVLYSLHNIQITHAAARLVQSTDFSSGRVSFQQFQKALQDSSEPLGDAGLPNHFKDQAAAIIEDNSGPAIAPSIGSTRRPSTDISADPFLKREKVIQKGAARGPFESNPVLKTNKVSAGNPMAMKSAPAKENPYGVREMGNAATRMFVSGEMSRQEYEAFFVKIGIQPLIGSELRKLVCSHERTGNGNFVQLTRALNFEIDVMEKAAAAGGR